MKIYGGYFKTIKGILKLFKPAKHVPEQSSLEPPTVFVGHHQNMRGPVYSALWYPGEAHIWVLGVFFTYKDCYRQFVDFTFTTRTGMPVFLAKIIAAPVAAVYSALMRSAGAIPVHRGTAKIRETISLSLDALKHGENIIVFPDIDYSSSNDDMGDIYTGFLQLERFYYKSEGKHLNFAPIAVDLASKSLRVGKKIAFKDGEAFIDGKTRIANELRDGINNLGKR